MDKGIGIAVLAFVAILAGIIFIDVLGDQIKGLDSYSKVRNDTFLPSNTTCTRIATGCIVSLEWIYNTTTAMGNNNATICRSSTGQLDGLLIDSQLIGGYNLNATYDHSDECTYITSTTSKTLINLVMIFFAIGIVITGVIMFNKMKEDWD